MKREVIRTGVALVHAIPGAAAMVTMSGGDQFLVAHHRPDALLTPCQLRAALIEPPLPGAAELIDSMTAMHLVGGVTHLGGGLFARSTSRQGRRQVVLHGVPRGGRAPAGRASAPRASGACRWW